jgi:hypothetical protein
MGLPTYDLSFFFGSFHNFFFVLCAECFDYDVSGGVSFCLMVWCFLRFLPLGGSLFLEVRECFS